MATAKHVGTALYGVLALPGSFLLCFGCLIFVSLSRGIEPDGGRVTSWQLAEAALAYGDTILVLGVVLVLSVLTVVLGYVSRNVGMKVIGVTCGAMFALTIGVVAVDARTGLSVLTERLREADTATAVPWAVPTREPAPTPAPLVADDARARMRQMLALTLTADDTLTGSGGRAVAPEAVELVASACDESGVRLSTTLQLRAMDNAGALRRILAAWDEAGFAPDRAMQEDIRYSQTDAVERMSIRDTTSIDGLIHLSIASRCAVA